MAGKKKSEVRKSISGICLLWHIRNSDLEIFRSFSGGGAQSMVFRTTPVSVFTDHYWWESGGYRECMELTPGQLCARHAPYPLYYHSSPKAQIFTIIIHHVRMASILGSSRQLLKPLKICRYAFQTEMGSCQQSSLFCDLM